MPERFREMHERGISRFLASGEAKVIGRTVELVGLRRDGSEFPLELALSVFEKEGSVSFTGLICDLSERRLSEETLRRSEELYSRLVNSLPDTFLALIDERLTLHVAGDAPVWIGWSREEIDGRAIRDVFPPERAELLEEAARAALNGERRTLEWPSLRLPRHFTLDLVPLRATEDDPPSLLLVGRDVTESRERERELAAARDEALEASRAKSAFLANMSHEIRTPMNGVIGMTELVLDTDVDAQQREYLETAHSSGEALMEIIEDVLDLSKIEAGRLQLVEDDFDPQTVVDEVCDVVAARAHKKGLELHSQTSGSLPSLVRGDEGRLRQIVLNLATNAIKFTEQGEVTVCVERLEDADGRAHLRYAVSDSGIGIDAHKLDTIFEAFQQADVSTTRRYGGSGLGLAISRELSELMGGELAARSTAGEGSTFAFTVSFELIDAALVGVPPELSGRRALIVDDNVTNRRILEERLRLWGMTTQSVSGGAQALEVLAAGGPPAAGFDLALLDFSMPEMNGLELARRLRAEGRPGLPLILLTSSGDQVAAARAAGVTGFATKPVRQEKLRKLLVAALSGADGVASAEAEANLGRPGTEAESPALDAELPRVLVVEDNPVNQTVAVKWLERLGFETEVAADGEVALVALERRRYAAVLMDCQMPRLDGYDATRALRQREGEGERTPVIAMTANAMKGDRERCLAAGMDDYLPKPVRPDTLGAMLARWVSESPGATANGDSGLQLPSPEPDLSFPAAVSP
jgi:PAS domain S-box-containing protein